MIDLDQSLIIQIVNFVIFLIILNYLIFKPIVRVLDERRDRIHGTMKKAQHVEADLQKKLEDYEERIRAAKSRAAEEKERLRSDAESLSKETVEKARSELARDIPIIRRQVATETDRVRRELEGRAEELARDIARRVLGRKIS